MTEVQTFSSVWDAIADTPEQAANLQVRAELLQQLCHLIQANHCGLTQPQINDLLGGRLSNFSLDALVNIAVALGQRVHMTLEAA